MALICGREALARLNLGTFSLLRKAIILKRVETRGQVTHGDSIRDDLGTTRFLSTFATRMLKMAAETDDPAFLEVGGAAERSDEIIRIERASREVYQY